MKKEFQVLVADSGTASEVIDTIDESQFVLAGEHATSIWNFFELYSGYWIFRSNIDAYFKYINSDNSKLLLSPSLSEVEREVAMIELNRLFINMLSSFRSFIDHAETKVTRLPEGAELLKRLKTAQAKEYDENIFYGLFWELRNFSQHCALPINSYSIEIKKSKNGLRFKGNIVSRIGCRHLLEHSDKWKPHLKEWLARNEYIEVEKIVLSVKKSILNIQSVILERDSQKIQEAVEFLTSFKETRDISNKSVSLFYSEDGKVKKVISISPYKLLVAKTFLSEKTPLDLKEED